MKRSDIIQVCVEDLERAWYYVQHSVVFDAPVVQRKVDKAKYSIHRLKEVLKEDDTWFGDEDFEL